MAKQAVIEAKKAQALRDQADGIQAMQAQLDRIEAKIDAFLRGELPKPVETAGEGQPDAPAPEPEKAAKPKK